MNGLGHMADWGTWHSNRYSYLASLSARLYAVISVAMAQNPRSCREDQDPVSGRGGQPIPIGSVDTSGQGSRAGFRTSKDKSFGGPGGDRPSSGGDPKSEDSTGRLSMFSRAINWAIDKSFENWYGVKPENASTIPPETELIIRKYVPERAYRETVNPILKVIRVHDD